MKATLPASWIGVEACWQLYSDNPLSHMVSVTPDQRRQSEYVIGSSGSGKTVLLQHLIAQDLERGHSICVLDLRGDMLNLVMELCAGRVDPLLVRVIDLRSNILNRFGFNALKGPGEFYYHALNVHDAVASETELGVQTSEAMLNALLAIAETGGSLTDLEDFFYSPAFREHSLSQIKHEPLRDFWKRYGAMPEVRQASFAMPVLNKMSKLVATPALRQILGHQAPIDLGKHLATPGSVLLVSLAIHETQAAGRMMGSLILSAICREVFSRVDTPEDQRNPLRLYVDEFENFSMKEFESILAEGRRFKFSMCIAHQTLAQLSPKMRSLILGNVGAKFVFRVGYEDGQILGKDIFHDAKFYNFTELPVGYCVMWRKNVGEIEVEINPPLIKNVGALSSEGAAFVRKVYEHAPPFVERARPRIEIEEPGDNKAGPKPKGPPPSLEEWL